MIKNLKMDFIMKNKFLLFIGLLTIFFSVQLSADTPFFYFGFKGGLNLAGWWGATSEPKAAHYQYRKPNYGGIGGIVFGIQPTDIFAIQPEVYYSMKGFREKMNDTTVLGVAQIKQNFRKMNYIEIPLLFKFLFANREKTTDYSTVNVFIGPVFGYRLDVKGYRKIETDSVKTITPYSAYLLEYIDKRSKKIDLGIVAGISYAFPVGPGSVTLDIRGTLGVLNIFKQSYIDEIEKRTNGFSATHKNISLSILIGYLFYL